MNAVLDTRQVGKADIILIFVKSMHTRAASLTAGILAGLGSVVNTCRTAWATPKFNLNRFFEIKGTL